MTTMRETVMRSRCAGLMAGLLLGGLAAGCQPNGPAEGEVATAPEQEPVLEPYPPGQVPPPESQPGPKIRAATRPDTPVDTTATAGGDPSTGPRPEPKEHYAPGVKKSARSHVVRKGETLQQIALDYYGSRSKWRRIYEANRQSIKDPNLIAIGMKLRIP